MKKKSLLNLFLMILGMCLLITACTPPPVEQGSVAVQVPQQINTAISIGIAALVTAGLVYVQRKLGLDLRGFGTGLAGTISIWVVTELQDVINSIPESYDPTLNFIFYVVIYVLGTAGALYLAKGKEQEGDPERLL